MLWLFTLAVFLAAWLLFLVQPLAAKLILPLLGGSPGVWNTANLFFQSVLLAGYLYAHLLGKLKRTATQAWVHAGVFLAAAVMLPIGLPKGDEWTPVGDQSPAWWTLLILGVAVGAPFFAIASAGPLLQRWFGATDHRRAKDPYFLYAASNFGSMLALVMYPLVVEPNATLTQQRWGWSVGFGLLACVMIAAGLVAARRAGPVEAVAASPPSPSISWRTRLTWILLAFVPSSLMLGTTLYLTMDIAAVPLLWVAPLAIYLLTFIIAFSTVGRLGARAARVAGWLVPLAAVAAAVLLLLDKREPIAPIILVHLGVLFIIALACHGRLAAERPPVDRLTEFYLLIAVGGVLGGVFNALLAPALFWGIAEYPIAIVLACALRPQRPEPANAAPLPEWAARVRGVLDLALPAGVIVLYYGLVKGLISLAPVERGLADFAGRIGLESLALSLPGTSYWVLPALYAMALSWQRLRFALCAAALFVLPALHVGESSRPIATDRTFFGVLTVKSIPDGSSSWHSLSHGRTLHGKQYRQFPWSEEPVTYYAKTGPIGDLFRALHSQERPLRVACVGLGTGTLAAHARSGDAFTFYEIDPGVERLAENPDLFSYLDDARDRGADVKVTLGDARVTITRASDAGYDAILIDAFSSDAIPAHLITREAIDLYLRKLAPDGVLVFHITNWYIDLEPVLAIAAEQAGLVASVRSHYSLEPEEKAMETTVSKWAVLTRVSGDLGRRLDSTGKLGWRPLKKTLPAEGEEGAALEPPSRIREIQTPWTDDYTDLLSVFRWR